MFCWCPTARASAIIALFDPWLSLFDPWLSLFGICCLLQLLQAPFIQHPKNWYRKKDTTSAVTKITKIPLEPSKLNAIADSLSTSEVDVRIVFSACGAVRDLHMLMMLGLDRNNRTEQNRNNLDILEQSGSMYGFTSNIYWIQSPCLTPIIDYDMLSTWRIYFNHLFNYLLITLVHIEPKYPPPKVA